MNRLASLVLLAVGVASLGMGLAAWRSASSVVSRAVTGAPTDRALLLLVGGGLATAAGLRGLAASR